MLNNSDRFALEAFIGGYFIGTTSRRESAVITVGRELSDRAIHRDHRLRLLAMLSFSVL